MYSMKSEELFDIVEYSTRQRFISSRDEPLMEKITTCTCFLYTKYFLKKPFNEQTEINSKELVDMAVAFQLELNENHLPIAKGSRFHEYYDWLSEAIALPDVGADYPTRLMLLMIDKIIDCCTFHQAEAMLVCERIFLPVVDFFRLSMLEDAAEQYRASPSFSFFESVADDYERIRQGINE